MEIIFWMGFYFLTFYAVLPALVSRLFGFKVFLKGKSDHGIALTFDDGPDPIYTTQLLDLLKEHHARATFFVVGENAAKHPEIIQRIHAEGHVLGIHNYGHHMNWFMFPSTVKKQIRLTSELIEGLTGVRSQYYRPPWGIVNVFDYARLGHLQIVLWTSLFGDWKAKVGPDRLYRRLKRKLKPGQVMLLHDCGKTFGADHEAPANMIAALERILIEGKQKSLRFVGIDTMIKQTEQVTEVGYWKGALVSLWMGWEKIFHVMMRIHKYKHTRFLHYRIRKYRGKTCPLRDKQVLHNGDWIMELHFDNWLLYHLSLKSKTSLQLAIRIIREVEQALPGIAREAQSQMKIKALYGISMIHRGSESLGFDTFALPDGVFSFLTKNYLHFMMKVLHPQGGKRVSDHTETLSPCMIVMGRDTLLKWENESRNPRHKKNKGHAKEKSENFDCLTKTIPS